VQNKGGSSKIKKVFAAYQLEGAIPQGHPVRLRKNNCQPPPRHLDGIGIGPKFVWQQQRKNN